MTRYAVYDPVAEEFATQNTYASLQAARAALPRVVPAHLLADCQIVDFAELEFQVDDCSLAATQANTQRLQGALAADAPGVDFRKTAGCTLALILIGLSAGVSLGLAAFLIHTGWRLVNWF